MRHSCRPHRTRAQQWTKQHQQQVLHLRQRYPLSGQRKIWKVRCRDQGFPLSISTVGRIRKQGVERKRVRAVAFYYGRVTPKRRRQCKHHAQRWHYGMKAKRPGELLQIEHMRVCVSAGFTLKDFKATGPVTGTTRYEFYPFYQGALTIAGVNRKLDEYQHYYNHYRPHDSTGLETPRQYYQQLMPAA